MKNIITIQHTQSVHHTNGMVGSWTDWDITAYGCEQAERIGRRLAVELTDKNYCLYTSDLLRAKHTADIIAGHLNITPNVTAVLRERNLGAAVGKSVQWLRENIRQHEKTVDDRCFEDAESRRDVWLRLQPFYETLMNEEAENVILVSHGDTLSLLNAMWLGLKVEALNSVDLFGMAGGVSFFYETQDGKHVIKRLSDMSYQAL